MSDAAVAPGGKPTLNLTPSAIAARGVPANGVPAATDAPSSDTATITSTIRVSSGNPGGKPMAQDPNTVGDYVPNLSGMTRLIVQAGFPVVVLAALLCMLFYLMLVEMPRTRDEFSRQLQLQRDHDDARVGRLYDILERNTKSLEANTMELRLSRQGKGNE